MSARHDQNAPKFLRGHPIDRLVRGFLNPSTTSIDWLEYLERQLTAAEEHELARWMRRLRQERQALPVTPRKVFRVLSRE